MAIIIEGKTKCSICGTVLHEKEDIVSTSHFIADKNHPLWKYSDSGMHKKCFLNWMYRDEFRDYFNKTINYLTPNKNILFFMEADGIITKNRSAD